VVLVALRLLLFLRSRAEQAVPAPAEPPRRRGHGKRPAPGEAPPAALPRPPRPAAGRLRRAGGLPCSALVPTIKGHAVRVQGYLARSVGQARLKNTLAALPGVAEVDLALQEVDEDKCGLMRVLGRYWVAHRMAPGAAADGTSIRLNPGSGRGAPT
jgi:hypothetical protein